MGEKRLQIREVVRIRRNSSRMVPVLLSCILLFQSCVVYDKTPVSLEEAALQQNKTKITTTSEDTFKYAYISLENGVYYGLKKKSGKMVKSSLRPEEISEIRVKDNTSSTWVSLAFAAGVVLLIGSIVYGGDITVFGREVK